MPRWLSANKKKAILDLHGMKCFYCGRSLYDPAGQLRPKIVNEKGEQILCFDHVKPRLLGGSNNPENIVPCCWRCNSIKGGKEIIDLDCGG